MDKKINPVKIVLGIPIISKISALKGGNAERVVREIRLGKERYRCKRTFNLWKNDACSGYVSFQNNPGFPLELKLGVCEGLHLYDTEELTVKNFSLKPRSGPRIPISSRKMSKEEIRDIANQIIGAWVQHGMGWKNRNGELFRLPFGADPKTKPGAHFSLHSLQITKGISSESPGWSVGTEPARQGWAAG